MALSKEAQKIKTEYNKKYMERYWERKAEKRKNETKAAADCDNKKNDKDCEHRYSQRNRTF